MPNDTDIKLPNKIEGEKIIERTETAGGQAEEVATLPEKEKGPEISSADKDKVLEEIERAEHDAETARIKKASNIQARQQQRHATIEKVLSGGLEDVYAGMPPDKQQEFKQAGEKTANEILTLLAKAKVKIKSIIHLIKKWLLIIPGVNKFFLEQEAKIKADEIMKLKGDS